MNLYSSSGPDLKTWPTERKPKLNESPEASWLTPKRLCLGILKAGRKTKRLA